MILTAVASRSPHARCRARYFINWTLFFFRKCRIPLITRSCREQGGLVDFPVSALKSFATRVRPSGRELPPLRLRQLLTPRVLFGDLWTPYFSRRSALPVMRSAVLPNFPRRRGDPVTIQPRTSIGWGPVAGIRAITDHCAQVLAGCDVCRIRLSMLCWSMFL